MRKSSRGRNVMLPSPPDFYRCAAIIASRSCLALDRGRSRLPQSGRAGGRGRDVQSRRVSLAHVLHEELLREPIRLAVIVIMLALTGVAELLQSRDAKLSAGFAEGLEGVLGLPRRHDVSDETE